MSSVDSKNTKSSRNGPVNKGPLNLDFNQPSRPRDIPLAVWELARLHTKEGWLAVEPAGKQHQSCPRQKRRRTLADTDSSSLGCLRGGWYLGHLSRLANIL